MLDAVTLLRTLHGLLPPAWDDALAPATPDDYGALMHAALHAAAARLELSCCCPSPDHSRDHDPHGRMPRGYTAHYPYEMTWYRAWQTWELPAAAVVVHAGGRFDAWLQHHWLLMMAAAPLRVSCPFTARAEDQTTWCPLLRSIAEESGWPPPVSEDLVLLGHVGMGPRDHRVLYRGPEQPVWLDLGALGEAIRRLERRDAARAELAPGS